MSDDIFPSAEFSNKAIESFFDSGRFFLKPKSLNLIFDGTASDLMAFLISVSRMTNSINNKDGWFYCTTKKIQRELFLSRRQYDHAMKKFKAEGYIETKLEGLPAVRYIRINYKKLASEINRAYENWIKEDPQLKWEMV